MGHANLHAVSRKRRIALLPTEPAPAGQVPGRTKRSSDLGAKTTPPEVSGQEPALSTVSSGRVRGDRACAFRPALGRGRPQTATNPTTKNPPIMAADWRSKPPSSMDQASG